MSEPVARSGLGRVPVHPLFLAAYPILNAYHLAGAEAPEPWPGISPVNSFRLILSAYFGADLPALPDRHFVFRDGGHPYDLIDVTDRVRPLAGG